MQPIQAIRKFVALFGCILGYGTANAAAEVPRHGHVRLAAYKVLFGNWAEPERIGEMFRPYRLDLIGFSEVPDGDWTKRVGRALGMKHVYVGDS